MKMSLCYALVLLGFILVNASPVFGQTTETKVKKIPFHGKIASVDTSADTITISGKNPRVFHLTSTTKIIDGAGNPTTLSTATAGEESSGSYSKDASGTMTLYTLRIGAKAGGKTSSTTETAAAPEEAPASAPAPAPKPTASSAAPAASAAPATAATTKAKKQTFSGKVVSVDSSANTLVVHGKADQTFTVTSATKFTGNGSDLSAVTPGIKVSGSYTKSADGATLTVTTLKIGK
jgi:hypothetical protein